MRPAPIPLTKQEDLPSDMPAGFASRLGLSNELPYFDSFQPADVEDQEYLSDLFRKTRKVKKLLKPR